MKTLASALALLLLAARLSSAQPAEPPLPSPTPQETATPTATPIATPTEPSPATPEATPVATPTPTTTATPEPTPSRGALVPGGDYYREGVSGSAPGVRPLRVFAAAGVHAFYGEGWNEDASIPGEDPPKTEDYVGGGLRVGASWELTPSIAAVAQAGGHQGRHSFGEDGNPEPLSIAYGLYYLAGGARWQTRPRQLGAYAEGGGGFAIGRVIVTRPDATDDAAEDQSYPTFVGYGAVGLTGHVARGMDVFVEARFMTAPHGADSFTSDHELDLGGLTASAGISLRL